ncbi:hypothetical protein AVEN_143674-1 [Araneus ventricosus]|uniref:Uncharacterized protein n=1 Tax=Araneus ventricosus TaxID=182803 RepID=A0A4Y2ANA5_ARAVE|nr:hypothetical protein AVEN_143674-1 [Araneus ventricosus]
MWPRKTGQGKDRIPDEAEGLIAKIVPNYFQSGMDLRIKETLEAFDKLSDSIVTMIKKTYTKTLQNQMITIFFHPFLNMIKDLSSEISTLKIENINLKSSDELITTLRAENFDLRELTTNNESVIMKAKLKLLQKEKQELMSQLKLKKETINELEEQVSNKLSDKLLETIPIISGPETKEDIVREVKSKVYEIHSNHWMS